MYPYKDIKYNHLIRCIDKPHVEIFIRLKVNDSIEKASIVFIKVSGFWESPRFVSIYAIIMVNRKSCLKLHTIYKNTIMIYRDLRILSSKLTFWHFQQLHIAYVSWICKSHLDAVIKNIFIKFVLISSSFKYLF